MVINSAKVDPAKEIQDKIGGAQAAFITATAAICYDQALASVRAAGRLLQFHCQKETLTSQLLKQFLMGLKLSAH